MQSKKKQLMALIVAGFIAVICFSAILFGPDIIKLLDNKNKRIIKEANWESDSNLGELSSASDIKEETYQHLTDSLGNDYTLRCIEGLNFTAPLPSDKDNWSYSIKNDVLYLNNHSEDKKYNGIQISVLSCDYTYNNLKDMINQLGDKLKLSLIYNNALQNFRSVSLLWNTQNNDVSEDDLLEYTPSITYGSLLRAEQFINPYTKAYVIKCDSKAFIVFGTGSDQQKKQVDVISSIVKENIKEQNDIESDPSLYLNNKVELKKGVTLKLPQKAKYTNNSKAVIGRLDSDVTNIGNNICFYAGFISRSSKESENNAYLQLYKYSIAGEDMPSLTLNISSAQMKTFEFENEKNKDGAVYKRSQIHFEGYDAYSVQSLYDPLIIQSYVTQYNKSEDKIVLVISNQYNASIATSYLQQLSGNFS